MVAVAIAMLVGTIYLFKTMPTGFIPSQDSGFMFAGLLANVLNGGEVVGDNSVGQVLPAVKRLFDRMGYTESSSGKLFDLYIGEGMGAKPIIVGYENQLIEYALAHKDKWPAVQAMADDKILALYEQGSYEMVPHDGMRRIIAQRLSLSKQTIPHFYLTVACRIDELLRARESMNRAAPKEGPRAYKLSVNDFAIKALALALAQVPAANVTWTEGGMMRHKYSDVGVAVAVAGGLFTPVIRHAELKSLSEISNEMRDLAERARKRRLAPHEYQGGTTSISNLGMYGIKSFEAVINPPHATILAVGAGTKSPIVVADRIEVATLVSCTLSADHRAVDGAVGAELLNAFRALIEDPVRMLV